MSFLTPLFLVALAGLAIPVLLHLIQREKKHIVQFPSLMFLRRIPYQSVKRRRIRHWLLLAMRLAALALIVMAFARPFLRRPDLAASAAAGAREVVVLLDRSYSMGYGDRWQRATTAARNAIGGLGAADRGSVVLFAAGAEVALRSTGDRGRLQAAIADVQAGAGATRFAPALKLAGSILSESALPRKEVLLISDFQRSGWQGAEGVRLPDGAVLTPVAISDADPANLSIAPVALQRTRFENQERIAVTSGVFNRSARAVSNVDVTLEIGGRPIQTRRANVDAGASASVTFDPVTVAERNVRATVRLPGDRLAPDNVFHFVVSPVDPIGLVVAERNGAPRDASLFLVRALAVGDSPRFQASVRAADSLSDRDLESVAVVVLNDTPVAQTTAERLHRFVERGGGLFLVAGERTAWAGAPEWLPGTIGPAVDRSAGQAARLGALEYGHPIFELFRAPRTGDFSAARFYGYRAITPGVDARVLARFDDGAPALVERTIGSGRVVLLASTVDLFWNDLAVKPVFLPFVHRVVRHLSAYREPRPWRTVGEVVDPLALDPGSRTEAAPSRVVLTPAGQRLSLDEEGADVLELAEQGFYEVRAQGTDVHPAIVLASNVDLGESDLTPMDANEVVAAAVGRAGGAPAGEAPPPTDQAQEAAQRIWWYLLFAGLLLLGAETFVANRLTV